MVVAVVDCGFCGCWIVAIAVIGLWLSQLLIGGCCGCWIVAVTVIGLWLSLLLDCGCHSH